MRSVFLDLWRILAISLLLISHIAQVFNHPLGKGIFDNQIYTFALGYIAVTFFIILSGITLEINYGVRSLPYLKFIKKRLLKIYPLYWLALLFSILIFIIKMFSEATDKSVYNWQAFSFLNLSCSFLGFCSFIGKYGGPFLGTGWFIGLIITLYFFFPVISKLMKKDGILVLFITLITSLVVRLILTNSWTQEWMPLSRIFEFSLGVFLAQKIPSKFWLGLNFRPFINKFVSYLSEISFPLFLVHFPLQFLATYSIIAFLFISIVISHLLLVISKKAITLVL